MERVSKEAKAVVNKVLNDKNNYARYKVNIYDGASGIVKTLWCGDAWCTPANETRGTFSGGGFACDKDTVFAYYCDNVVFWHKGYLAHMVVSNSNFDIYVCEDVPYIENKDCICQGSYGYKRPCVNWVEPVDDEYLVLKEVNQELVDDACRIGYIHYNIKRGRIWLLNPNERVCIGYKDLQKMVKLGILSNYNLVNVVIGSDISLGNLPDNFVAGDLIIKDKCIWCNGRAAKANKASDIFIEDGTASERSIGQIIVSNSDMKFGVSKNEFLRGLL